MVIIISAATFISTLLGGFFALKFRNKLYLVLGFSAGAMIGVAFFDLLPAAIVEVVPALPPSPYRNPGKYGDRYKTRNTAFLPGLRNH